MIIFCVYDLGDCAVRVWDEEAWIRWLGEWIVRLDVPILCGCEDHAKVAIVAASQGGCD